MKKLLVLLFSTVLAFTSCSRGSGTSSTGKESKQPSSTSSESGSGEEHTHTYASEWSYDENYHWHAATCGHNVTKDRGEHVWDNGTVTLAPTYEAKGTKTYTCATCGKTKTEEIPQLVSGEITEAEWNEAVDIRYKNLTMDFEIIVGDNKTIGQFEMLEDGGFHATISHNGTLTNCYVRYDETTKQWDGVVAETLLKYGPYTKEQYEESYYSLNKIADIYMPAFCFGYDSSYAYNSEKGIYSSSSIVIKEYNVISSEVEFANKQLVYAENNALIGGKTASSKYTISKYGETTFTYPALMKPEENIQVTNGQVTIDLNTALNDFHTKIDDTSYYYRSGFTKKMNKPDNVISSVEQLTDLLDYCAFYKEPSASFSFNNPEDAEGYLNLAYWNSTMLPGTVDFEKTVVDDQYFLTFIYRDDANSYKPKNVDFSQKTYIPYVYNGTGDKITNLPTLSGQELEVYNSDQLIYALTHGYTPVLIANSPAESIYNKASSVLKNIIYSSMDQVDKIVAVDNWISNNTLYDTEADGYAGYHDVQSIDNNPDLIASRFTAFYAEGVFDQGAAVCYGYAKAEAILLGLLGMNVNFTHAKMNQYCVETHNPISASNEDSPTEYLAHGLLMVEDVNTGKFGVCDPTYRYAGTGLFEERLCDYKRLPAALLSLDFWSLVYSSTDVAFAILNPTKLMTESADVASHIIYDGVAANIDLTLDGVNNAFSHVDNAIDQYKAANNITDQRMYLIQFFPAYYDAEHFEQTIVEIMNQANFSTITDDWSYYRYFYNLLTTEVYGIMLWVYR